VSGVAVQELLDDFNERAEEFGITDEADILSVSAMPTSHNIPTIIKNVPVAPKIDVVIVYWANS
jgi:6,7-dimethyl-8-ribityllumazine synthase